MAVNVVKRRMLEGKPAIGAEAGLGSTLSAELISALGYDFIVVDNQHGAWSDDRTMQAFRSIALGSAVPMARVRTNDFSLIGQILDQGALGVIVPMVNSAEEAQAAVKAVRYPPKGMRSNGAFGVGFHGPDYMTWANDEVFLVVMIESGQALERAEEILSVDGVDGCWVGPHDLALTMGIDLNSEEGKKRHRVAIKSIIDACRKTNTIPGISLGSVPDAQYWLDQGCLFVTAGEDSGWMIEGAAKTLRQLARYRDGELRNDE